MLLPFVLVCVITLLVYVNTRETWVPWVYGNYPIARRKVYGPGRWEPDHRNPMFDTTESAINWPMMDYISLDYPAGEGLPYDAVESGSSPISQKSLAALGELECSSYRPWQAIPLGHTSDASRQEQTSAIMSDLYGAESFLGGSQSAKMYDDYVDVSDDNDSIGGGMNTVNMLHSVDLGDNNCSGIKELVIPSSVLPTSQPQSQPQDQYGGQNA